MNKIKEITTAWWNVAMGDDEIKMIAEARKKICDGCEFKTTMLNVDVCSRCHCPITGKVHSPANSCPLDKWDK